MMHSHLTDCVDARAAVERGALDRPDEGWQILTQS